MEKCVIIDCFPESALRYDNNYAMIVIDVIRATTTITTAIGTGRRVYPVQTIEEAISRAAELKMPLLVGEVGGNMPYGFDVTNSPDEINRREDIERPMVIVSSSGTQLLINAAHAQATYVACLRNLSAVVDQVSKSHERVAVLGAGTRGQFRREDQLACAWTANGLVKKGFVIGNEQTAACIERWKGSSLEIIRDGKSADYLRRSCQEHDLEFVLTHIDDLTIAPRLIGKQVVR